MSVYDKLSDDELQKRYHCRYDGSKIDIDVLVEMAYRYNVIIEERKSLANKGLSRKECK